MAKFIGITYSGRASGQASTCIAVTNRLTSASGNMNFQDSAIISPLLRWMGALGPIEGQRMMEILNAYTLAFFDRHLQGEDGLLLDGPSPDFPEVTIASVGASP